MPSSTSETASRSVSTGSFDSICSERMALFIGLPLFRVGECPPHDEFPSGNGAIRGANFDLIAAKLRHLWFIQPASPWRNSLRIHQLFLNPALMLLLVVPCGVSPIEPEMVTPSSTFCSAQNLRSHLSSLEDSVCPAVTLVPVSPIESFAD